MKWIYEGKKSAHKHIHTYKKAKIKKNEKHENCESKSFAEKGDVVQVREVNTKGECY